MDNYLGLEAFLSTNDFFWGSAPMRIKTILGSCIAITMWHPVKKTGGVSHSMLPVAPDGDERNPRYIDGAMQLFLDNIQKESGQPTEYEVKIFGGSQLMGSTNFDRSVGFRNRSTAKEILDKYGFKLAAEHSGGSGRRNLIFDLSDGAAWLRYVEEPVSLSSKARIKSTGSKPKKGKQFQNYPEGA